MKEIARHPWLSTESLISKTPSESRWTSLNLHAIVVTLIAILFVLIDNPSVILVVGGLLCAATYFFIGFMEGKRSALWFNPLSYYFFWYSVGLGLSAIYMGIATAAGEWMPFSMIMIPPENLAKAYVIFLFGSVAFHAGLQWFRPQCSEERSPQEVKFGGGRFWGLITMWMIGLWAGWNPDLLAPLGAPGKILPWLSLAALCMFAITPRERFGLSRIAFLSMFIVGIVGQFSANLLSFSKTYLMYSFFPLLWFFVIQKSLRRWLPILGVALALFYLTVLAPLVTVARQVPIQLSESQLGRLIQTFQGETPVWADYLYEMSYLDRVKMLLDRQFDPYPVGFFVEEVKVNGLQLGATMDYIAYAFIPRILWPEKPNVTRGLWFAAYTGFAPSEEESTTSLGITPAGELYWNFGVVGTIIGMFIIGGLLGGLWQMAGADPLQHPVSMVLFVMVMLGLPYVAEAITLLVAIVINFIVFKIAFSIIRVIGSAAVRARIAMAS